MAVYECAVVSDDKYGGLGVKRQYTQDEVEEIQRQCLSAVDKWSEISRSHFGWPFDFLDQVHPWAHDVTVAAVDAWNDEGRQTPCEEFYRLWSSSYTNIYVAVNGSVEEA